MGWGRDFLNELEEASKTLRVYENSLERLKSRAELKSSTFGEKVNDGRNENKTENNLLDFLNQKYSYPAWTREVFEKWDKILTDVGNSEKDSHLYLCFMLMDEHYRRGVQIKDLMADYDFTWPTWRHRRDLVCDYLDSIGPAGNVSNIQAI